LVGLSTYPSGAGGPRVSTGGAPGTGGCFGVGTAPFGRAGVGGGAPVFVTAMPLLAPLVAPPRRRLHQKIFARDSGLSQSQGVFRGRQRRGTEPPVWLKEETQATRAREPRRNWIKPSPQLRRVFLRERLEPVRGSPRPLLSSFRSSRRATYGCGKEGFISSHTLSLPRAPAFVVFAER